MTPTNRIEELEAALRFFQSFGCPVCHGDCSSANPPVSICPMKEAEQVLSAPAPLPSEEVIARPLMHRLLDRILPLVNHDGNRALEEVDAILALLPAQGGGKLDAEGWLNTPKYQGIMVLDPDGWDRKNFDSSWAEIISEQEFERRLSLSTCKWPRRFLDGETQRTLAAQPSAPADGGARNAGLEEAARNLMIQLWAHMPIVEAHHASIGEALSILEKALVKSPSPSAGERGWRTIDSAPKDKTLLLGFVNGYVGKGWWQRRSADDYDWFFETGGFSRSTPTHWMPLPAAPDTDMGER